ncbi:citrate/2-methylcitrate synthase [Nonomuraea soli]|uniref:citrate synthase (unknown stereospecificity) n=1 Tax=Nonomuraea soli TaxID=1032476 RepID=A0A7W0CP94_9ACTN|nr:citrate/2-methylcitrate synthase [Nonomuraea soli]MBA2894765.1 citrate synthase [Nonomuraea soli]
MEWIDAAAAAERLGVKQATLYAYVSRGVLRRRRGDDGKRSLFDPAEIEELARKGRPRRPPSPSELVIESSITLLGEDRPYYRGRDALELARECTFEEVAGWLWAAPGVWESVPEAVAAARQAVPEQLLPIERLQVITTVLGATDSLRFHLDPASVAATGHRLIAGLVDALPPAHAGATSTASVAERLWRGLGPSPADPGLLTALQAALVLLADHELAASTLAARVAASARADPYAVVLTGLGVLSGPRHGGASYAAERLLAEVGHPGRAARVIAERVRRGERIPGFGHTVYKHGDARAGVLMELIEQAAPGHERLQSARAVMDELRRRRLPAPNVDFALATLVTVGGMTPGSGEAIFAVARTAGWLAHAMEEYAGRTLLRPRAVYTGRHPGADQ